MTEYPNSDEQSTTQLDSFSTQLNAQNSATTCAMPVVGASSDTLRKAGADFSYLIDHGYDHALALEFVGTHYGLAPDARELLATSICGEQTRLQRAQTALSAADLAGAHALVDASSVLPAVAHLLARTPVVLAQDDTLQPAAADKNSAQPAQILHAVDVVLDILAAAGAASVTFCLASRTPDEERLATTIADYTSATAPITNPALTINCQPTADPIAVLTGKPALITQDRALIAGAQSWTSLAPQLLAHITSAQVIDPVFDSPRYQ